MARDYSQVNKMMDRMLAYLMQKALRDQGQEANLQFLERQLANSEQITNLRHQLQLELAGKENELKKDLTRYTHEVSWSELDDVQRLQNNINLNRMQGNEAKAQQLERQLEPLEKEHIRGIAGIYSGDITEELISAALPGLRKEDIARTFEAGVDVREKGLDRPITQQQADTSAGRLGLDIKRAGLEKEKFELEKTGVLSQKEYAADIADIIDDAVSFLDKAPVGGVALQEGGEPIPGLTEEQKGSIGAQLQSIKLKAKTQKLPAEEEKFITSIRDLVGVGKGIEEKTLPGMAYSERGKELTAQVDVDLRVEAMFEKANKVIGILIESGKTEQEAMELVLSYPEFTELQKYIKR